MSENLQLVKKLGKYESDWNFSQNYFITKLLKFLKRLMIIFCLNISIFAMMKTFLWSLILHLVM